jgi:hypothetical protein
LKEGYVQYRGVGNPKKYGKDEHWTRRIQNISLVTGRNNFRIF